MISQVDPNLSVIVPCFNEEESIQACHDHLSQVLGGTGLSYEILYIDDGSTDHTAAVLRNIQAVDPQVIVVRLSRNFGHQPAVTAGLSMVRGHAAVIIDADLQDPPELIPEMVALWRSGYQVVYGIRASREGETGFKLWTAKVFYRLINRLSDVQIPLDTGDFRLLDRAALQAMNQMPERHRLLRGMSTWIGFSQIGIKYDRAPRIAGETKYPLAKMLGLALDGVVSFSSVPLRFVTFAGLCSAAIAFLGILYSLAVRLFSHFWVKGWAISFIAMLFMAGLQMFCLGILGEYIGRIYIESKQRPLFLVREVIRSDATPELDWKQRHRAMSP